MDGRELVIRVVDDGDDGRHERLIALLALALERQLSQAKPVDFAAHRSVYPFVHRHETEAPR